MDAPLAQYANDRGSLVHPERGRVFACETCDFAPPRYEPSTGACWCPGCGASLAPEQIRDREAETNLRGLDTAGKLLWHAPKETPISDLAELREEYGDDPELVTDGGFTAADHVANFTQDGREHTRVRQGEVTVTVTHPTDADPRSVKLALAAAANACETPGATTPADSPGHAGAVAAQLRQADQNGTLPDGVDLHGGDD